MFINLLTHIPNLYWKQCLFWQNAEIYVKLKIKFSFSLTGVFCKILYKPLFTCKIAAVDFNSHTDGSNVKWIRDKSHFAGNDRRIQLLLVFSIRVNVAFENLKLCKQHQNSTNIYKTFRHYNFSTIMYSISMQRWHIQIKYMHVKSIDKKGWSTTYEIM